MEQLAAAHAICLSEATAKAVAGYVTKIASTNGLFREGAFSPAP
jgi:hypothetical protein